MPRKKVCVGESKRRRFKTVGLADKLGVIGNNSKKSIRRAVDTERQGHEQAINAHTDRARCILNGLGLDEPSLEIAEAIIRDFEAASGSENWACIAARVVEAKLTSEGWFSQLISQPHRDALAAGIEAAVQALHRAENTNSSLATQ